MGFTYGFTDLATIIYNPKEACLLPFLHIVYIEVDLATVNKMRSGWTKMPADDREFKLYFT